MTSAQAERVFLMKPPPISGEVRLAVTVARPSEDVGDLLPAAAAAWLGSPIPVWANPSLVGKADYYLGGPNSWTVVSRRLLEVIDASVYEAFPLALHEHPGWHGKRGESYGELFAPSVPKIASRFSTGDLWVVQIPGVDILDPKMSILTRRADLAWPACVLSVEKYVFRMPFAQAPGIFRLRAGQFGRDHGLSIAASRYPWISGSARARIEKAGLLVDWWKGFEASFAVTE